MNRLALAVALVLAGLLILFAPVVAYGDVCRNGTCAPTVVTQTYATPAYATQLLIPTYGVSYVPTYGGATDETNRLLQELLAENRAIRAELAQLRTAGPAAQARDPKPIIKQWCAACHTEGTANNDFTLFDEKGEPYALSSVDRKTMARLLRDGKMPKPQRDPTGLMVQRMPQADREALAQILLNPPPAPKPAPELKQDAPKPIPKLPDVPTVPKPKDAKD